MTLYTHLIRPQHGLELPAQAEVCLLFKECSWSQRGLEGRGLVHTSTPLQAKDLLTLTPQGNAGTEGQDQWYDQEQSSQHRCAVEGFGSVFPLEFVSKCRLSDYIFNDLVPNRFIVMYINIWPSYYPVDNVSQSRIRCEG